MAVPINDGKAGIAWTTRDVPVFGRGPSAASLSHNSLSPGRRVPRCNRGAGEGNVAELQHTFESIKISFESFPLNLTFSQGRRN